MILAPVLLVIGFLAGFVLSSPVSQDEVKDRIAPSVYLVYDEDGHGTGFTVELPNGEKVVLTNRHVCGFKPDHKLTLRDHLGNDRPTHIIKISQNTDLCALAAPKDAVALPIADSVAQDERIFTAGYPLIKFMSAHSGRALGMEEKPSTIGSSVPDELSVEQCSIYGVLKVQKTMMGDFYYCVLSINNVIATDMMIAVGASGSPAVNASGEVVGIIFGGPGLSNRLVLAHVIHLSEIQEFLKSIQ